MHDPVDLTLPIVPLNMATGSILKYFRLNFRPVMSSSSLTT